AQPRRHAGARPLPHGASGWPLLHTPFILPLPSLGSIPPATPGHFAQDTPKSICREHGGWRSTRCIGLRFVVEARSALQEHLTTLFPDESAGKEPAAAHEADDPHDTVVDPSCAGLPDPYTPTLLPVPPGLSSALRSSH